MSPPRELKENLFQEQPSMFPLSHHCQGERDHYEWLNLIMIQRLVAREGLTPSVHVPVWHLDKKILLSK